MYVEQLIETVNAKVEELDLVTARKLMEDNIDYLRKNERKLKKNGRELLKFITDSIESGYQHPTRHELAIYNSINSYASKFDVRGLKLLIQGNEQTLLKKAARSYLNGDAKVLLEGLGAISKE
ncbi:hypothetical protein [Niallia taxi]|uniref:hypothetical protein n=1 Tax=Niallia taxi TaxID=2499688 RepID=UPI0011A6DA0E|nr:hypothetical protein [Niallia taxi]MCT2345054.1 hypothetical protein [Niallia taxi]MED3962968.1 hypothetical protein [Niallia taxi]WOD65549.1 hypothetical protein NQZ71_20220 [Niallia taxi]